MTADRVVAYDPAWPAAFEVVRARLATVLPGDVVVEHVGSTAVPGLAGKPIVDVDVVVERPDEIGAVIERLASIGYRHQGDLGIPGREAFEAPPGPPLHHLYVVARGSEPHRDHVDLRDHLRGHPDDVARYAAEKRRLAHLLLTDRDAYTRVKGTLVEDLLRGARGGSG